MPIMYERIYGCYLFMNVYAIGGYIEGESETTIEIRAEGNAVGLEFDIEEGYHGNTHGIGTTLVCVIKDKWVVSLDINYAEADLNFVDGSIKTLMTTQRINFDMHSYEAKFYSCSLQRRGLPAFFMSGGWLDSDADSCNVMRLYGHFYSCYRSLLNFFVKEKKWPL